MDSLEFNKFAGALLATGILLLGSNIVSGVVFTPKKPAIPGYELPGAEAAPAAEAPAAAAAEPIAVRLASADAARGERAVSSCKSCHSFEKGGANKVGPALYGVYDRNKAAVDGFAYSAAAKAKSGEPWSAEALDAFIANPKAYLPGTSMAFAGISRPEQRADIVAYLNSLADAPKPLPKP